MTLWCIAARQRIRHGTLWAEHMPIVKRITWYGQIFFGFFAIFASVVGTTLQLLGVYRTCLCLVSPSALLPPFPFCTNPIPLLKEGICSL